MIDISSSEPLVIDNNQQKYNSTRLDVHKNTIQEIRNHIFRKLFSNKGNAKHGDEVAKGYSNATVRPS
jgi:hypothetical protein